MSHADPPAGTPAPTAGSPRRALAVIFFTVFLDLLGFGMIIPILQLYAERLHATIPQTGWLLSIYSIMQFVFAPLWGRLSDRVGRRPVLLVSILGSCLSQLGYALSPGFWYLLASRGIAGVCGANIAAAQAYVADVTDERSRAAAMGTLGAALGLGFIVGPVLGGELGKISPRLPFFCASALAALNFLLAFLLVREPVRRRLAARQLTLDALWRSISAPQLAALLVVFFIVTFGFANMEGVFALFCQSRFGYGEARVGRLFALIGLVMVVVQGGLVRRLAPRLGEATLVALGVALMGGGLVLLALAHDLPYLLGGLVIMAAGSGLNSPSLSTLLTRAAGEQRGSVLGVSQSLGSLGRILGPILGTRLLAGLGTSAPLLVAAGCMGVGLVVAVLQIPGPGEVAASPGRG